MQWSKTQSTSRSKLPTSHQKQTLPNSTEKKKIQHQSVPSFIWHDFAELDGSPEFCRCLLKFFFAAKAVQLYVQHEDVCKEVVSSHWNSMTSSPNPVIKVWSMRESSALQKCLRDLKKLLGIMLPTVVASTIVVGAFYLMVADWANNCPFPLKNVLVAYLNPEAMSCGIVVLSSNMLGS